METVSLSRLEPHLAASMLAGIEALDPRGIWTAQDIPAVCERGQCFALTVGQAQGVYVLHVQNGRAWVQAAAGTGPADLTRCGLSAIEAQLAGQCESVSFMTARRGLVLKAAKQGYRVSGYVLRKDLKRWT